MTADGPRSLSLSALEFDWANCNMPLTFLGAIH
jgi:hypothetical protein